MAPTKPLGTLRGAAGILGVILVGISAWLLFPRTAPGNEEQRSALRVVLVDASASVRRTRPLWRSWVRRELEQQALAAAEAGELLAVVSFASEVGVSFAPDEPAVLLDDLRGRGGRPFDPAAFAGSDHRSELAGAVEVACGLASGVTVFPTEFVLLGTATYTGVDPAPGFARARRMGATLLEREPPAPTLSDLALRDLHLPKSIEAGAPLVGRARLALVRGATPLERGWLELEIESAGEVERRAIELRLPAGDGEFDVAIPCGTASFGRTEVRLRARLEPGPDPVPENDRARGACLAEGELVVGVVAAEDQLAAARAWLTPSGSSALAGLQFVFLTPPDLLGQLEELDLFVSFDLALRDLPLLLIEDFVLRQGGGWLATSGWRFLEDWVPGEDASGLGELLPLEPEPLDRGPRDVVLLVDGSGSMQGAPFETVRAACLDLVAASLPSDEVSLRFFTGRLEEAHLIKERVQDASADRLSSETAARRLLELRVPTGETHILLSLERFAETRRGAREEALVLLLTDGREREAMPDPEGRAAALLESLAAEDASLSVIAVGKDADLRFLGYLARPGEEVSRPENLEDLRALFRREISGAQWRAGGTLALAWARADEGSIAGEIRGVDPPAVPSVERLVKNQLRPGAEVLWVDDESRPVLAVQRAGLGRTALVGSHPGAGWAPSWGGRFGLGEPVSFGSLLRWLGRGTRRRDDGLRLEREGERLVLSGLARTWPARVEARVVDAQGGVELGRLGMVPPAREGAGDPLGRRVGVLEGPVLDLARAGQPVFVLERPEGAGTWIEPLILGPADEFAGREDALELAALGGGPTGQEARRHAQEPHPWAPGLLLAGLVLLLLGAVLPGGGQGIAASVR